VLQCLWSAVALWKVTWGGSTFTLSQQLPSVYLQGDRGFPAASPGTFPGPEAFLPWHRCLIWSKFWCTKQGFLLRTATNWSFGLFTVTTWNLEYNFLNSVQEGAVSSLLSQSYFNSAGLTSKKNSENFFSPSRQISQNAPKHLNCWLRRYLFTYSFLLENHFITLLHFALYSLNL